jgi:PAS domain S-box-containing protein
MRAPEPEPEHLLAIFNAAPEPYLVLSPDLRIVLANDCYLHTFGFRRETLVGRSFGELFGEAAGEAGNPAAAAMHRSAGQLHQTGRPDAWPPVPYQPTGSGALPGYGQVLNTPVPGAEGRLQYILHKVTPVPGPAVGAGPEADARQAALRQQEKAEQILNSFNAALVELDGEYRYRYINDRAEEMLGKQREELLGQVIWEVFPHTVDTPGAQAIVRATQGREKAEAEYLSTVYGRWMYMSAVPNGEGGALILMYDRHDMHQAQEQLEQEHHRLKQAQAIGHIGSFEWTPATDTTHWSDEMYRIHGLEPQAEPINLQRVLSFIHPEDKSWVIEKIRQAQQKAGRTSLTHRLVRPDGEVRYIRRYVESFADAQGKVTHLSGMVQDITEQKRAEQEGKLFQLQLQQSAAELAAANAELRAANEESRASNEELFRVQEALRDLNAGLEERVARRTAELHLAQQAARTERDRLHHLFMQAPAVICIFQGPDLVYELVNPAYQALFPGRELLGKSMREALPEAEYGPLWELMREVYRSGRPYQGNEVLVPIRPHADAPPEDRYWNVTYQARRDARGETDGLLVFAYDVTEQLRSRRRIEESEKALQTLNQELEAQVARRTGELQNARAEAELERQRLHHAFMQAPALICIFEGPRHVFRFVNPPYQQLVGERPLLGLPIAEAMPELAGQPIFDLLDGVYRTGETFYAHEMKVQLDHHNQGELGHNYYNFIYQAIRNPAGEIDGIFVFAYEVTVLVEARQQVEESRKALQELNEKLAAANAELRGANAELVRTQRTLQRLNTDLEARVGRRTAQLEAARAEAEAGRRQLHALFMEAPAPIVILDGPDLVMELVNPAYQRIFPGREMRGKPLLAALPEVAGTAIHEVMRRVYRTGETFVAQEMPLRLARQAGDSLEEIYFTFTYQARRNGQGAVDGVLVFAYEVTDQVNARRAIEANARQLRLITDALPVLIGYVDQEEKYRFANRAYEPWFGRKPDELLGLTLREVLGEEAYAGVREHVARALRGEPRDFETRMPYREGFVKYIRTSYVPEVQAGRTVGFYALVSDVTEQVEARRQVEQREQEAQALAGELAAANAELVLANGQLKRTNTDLDNFVYTASHDLKAPILNVEGLLKALERQLGPDLRHKDTVRELYRMLYGSVNRFKATIADLTEVARIGKASAEDVASIGMGAVLDEVRQDLAPQIEETGATLEVSLDCPPLHFSRKDLKSIFYNLLGNAIKYHSPDRPPRVRIACHEEGNYQVLTVADNGLGIDMRQEHKIFALFKRLHAHVEGTGIGLYIVKRMIENAGGRIEVESQVDVGTTFRVYFRR